jgi:hypothetical protein
MNLCGHNVWGKRNVVEVDGLLVRRGVAPADAKRIGSVVGLAKLTKEVVGITQACFLSNEWFQPTQF